MDDQHQVLVRRAARIDESALLRLATSFAMTFSVDPAAFSQQFEAMLADCSCALMVAMLDDELVCYVAASVHPTLYANGPVGWIEEVMVDDSRRELGVGRLLVASVE